MNAYIPNLKINPAECLPALQFCGMKYRYCFLLVRPSTAE